jgi:hypothetical protein
VAGSPEVFASFAARLKSPAALRVIGLGVLVIAGGTFAGIRFLGSHAAGAAPSPATSVAAVQHVTSPAAPAPVNATAPVNAPVQVNAHTVPAQAVATNGTEAPVVRAVPQNAASASSPQLHVDDHLTYQYNALGRRDPFQSLVDGQFVGADVGGDAPPDPGGIKVVGIVWGANDQFALVEDVRGNSFVLRKGDKVQNGVVAGLKRDGVIVNITAEGQSQSVVIPLVRKGDQNAR